MGVGVFNNFRGSGPVQSVAATTASQSGDLGDFDGDAVSIVNQSADAAYVIFSQTAGPTAAAATPGVQMIAPNGWGIISRKNYANAQERYFAVVLASGTGTVRLQIGTGG